MKNFFRNIRDSRPAAGYILLLVSVPLCLAIMFSMAGSAETVGDRAVENNKGRVTGRIMIKDDKPLTGGFASFYDAASGPPPMPERYERIPDVSVEIDAEGRFGTELPPGKYFFGAIKRASGLRAGPPQAGDLVFRHVNEKGVSKEFSVAAGKLLDLGTLSSASAFRGSYIDKDATTAIEGSVTDSEGNPVEDVLVSAQINPNLQGRPLFVADKKTDMKGNYRIRLPEGTYFLKLRKGSVSGPPEAGQLVGYHGTESPIPVSIKEGTVKKGIDLKAIRFPGRGPAQMPAP